MLKKLKKLFIPHTDNNHKPHFLREKSALIITAVTIVLFVASIFGNYVIQNNSFLAAIRSAFLVDLTNETRVDSGIGSLAINQTLVDAAQLKANDMANKSYFAHTSPEGVTPWYWFDEAGYDYVFAGENLAVNFNESNVVHKAWLDSPTHKENIVNQKYTEIGIATSEGIYKGKNTTFVVQLFGSPALARPASLTIPIRLELEPIIENTEIAVATTPSVENPIEILGEETEIVDSSFVAFTNPDLSEEEIAKIEIINTNTEAQYTNWFERLVVSPTGTVNTIYMVLMAIIIFALILKIFVDIRKQHPKNIAYGVILIVIVLVFMHINQGVLIDPVIASI